VAVEIERKFLVVSEDWRAGARDPKPMVQGYLGGDRCAVRVRIAGERAWLSLKSATLDIARLEFEYAVPLADARQMLQAFASGPVVAKTRYHVPAGSLTWEVDVFEGENAGLVLAEIELPRVDADIPRPPWLGREVSGDARFLNINLARRPWRQWREDERAAC
jgi:adenylate cyclase